MLGCEHASKVRTRGARTEHKDIDTSSEVSTVGIRELAKNEQWGEPVIVQANKYFFKLRSESAVLLASQMLKQNAFHSSLQVALCLLLQSRDKNAGGGGREHDRGRGIVL